MATSGVSTNATSLGGAVRIAALPNLTANRPPPPVDEPSADDTGVPMRVEEVLIGVVGVRGPPLTLKRLLPKPELDA